MLPWVDSNLRVRSGLPFQECHQHKEKMEKLFYVDSGNAYCACPYFISPVNPGAVLLDPSYRNHSPSPLVGCQILCQYDFTIGPG